MTKRSQLTEREWKAVSAALLDAANCDCTSPPQPGSMAHTFKELAATIFGAKQKPDVLTPKLQATRQFICAAALGDEALEEKTIALAEHGFSARQIEALRLLSRQTLRARPSLIDQRT